MLNSVNFGTDTVKKRSKFTKKHHGFTFSS